MTNQLTKTMKNYRLHFTQLFEEVKNIEANDAAEAEEILRKEWELDGTAEVEIFSIKEQNND